MLRQLIFFASLFATILAQDSLDNELSNVGAPINEAEHDDSPILIEWRIRYSSSSKTAVADYMNAWLQFFQNYQSSGQVLVNTLGHYNQFDTVKHTLLFKDQDSMANVALATQNQTLWGDMWAITDQVRALDVSEFSEGGTIYNGLTGPLISLIWPRARQLKREITENAYGPQVHGWINTFEEDTMAIAPIILNQVYNSQIESPKEKISLIEAMMDHLNATGRCGGELTNLVVWVHPEGWTINYGFKSAFAYDVLLTELQSWPDYGEWAKNIPVFTQWIGVQADVDHLAATGDELYYGRPNFEPYGGDGQWTIIYKESWSFNFLLAYAVVPALDVVAGVINAATNPYLNGWYVAVYSTQGGLFILGALVWSAAVAASVLGYHNESDKIVAIWAIFHIIGEAAAVTLTTWADYYDTTNKFGNAYVNYGVAGFNILLDIAVIILELSDVNLRAAWEGEEAYEKEEENQVQPQSLSKQDGFDKKLLRDGMNQQWML